MNQAEYELHIEQRERHEHADALLQFRAVLRTEPGRKLVKYLFREFDVAGLPERGLPPDELREYLGLLRAGQSIFKMAAECEPEIAASLLASVERERYDLLQMQARIKDEPSPE